MHAPCYLEGTTHRRPALSPILAIDLVKYNSVFCWFTPNSGEVSFVTAATTPASLRTELTCHAVSRVVIEACSPAGWVHDLPLVALWAARERPNVLRLVELPVERPRNRVDESVVSRVLSEELVDRQRAECVNVLTGTMV